MLASPTIVLNFSPAAIYVQVVAIDETHLDQLMNVVSKTEQFVNSMVRVPATPMKAVKCARQSLPTLTRRI